MQFLMYVLVFLFGYVTCKTFYFLRSAGLTLRTIRTAHLIYLLVVTKALENLASSRELMLEYLLRNEKSSNYITSFTLSFDKQVEGIKKESIKTLIAMHPELFREFIEFDDWETSMTYLQKHKTETLKFWSRM